MPRIFYTYMCENCFEPMEFEENESNIHICPKCNIVMTEFAKDVRDDSGKFIQELPLVPQQQAQQNTPKCPTCQSTNLKKILVASKAGSVFLFGIFAAGRTSKTWHCNNCGVEW